MSRILQAKVKIFLYITIEPFLKKLRAKLIFTIRLLLFRFIRRVLMVQIPWTRFDSIQFMNRHGVVPDLSSRIILIRAQSNPYKRLAFWTANVSGTDSIRMPIYYSYNRAQSDRVIRRPCNARLARLCFYNWCIGSSIRMTKPPARVWPSTHILLCLNTTANHARYLSKACFTISSVFLRSYSPLKPPIWRNLPSKFTELPTIHETRLFNKIH